MESERKEGRVDQRSSAEGRTGRALIRLGRRRALSRSLPRWGHHLITQKLFSNVPLRTVKGICLERVLKRRSRRRKQADFPGKLAQSPPPCAGSYDSNARS